MLAKQLRKSHGMSAGDPVETVDHRRSTLSVDSTACTGSATVMGYGEVQGDTRVAILLVHWLLTKHPQVHPIYCRVNSSPDFYSHEQCRVGSSRGREQPCGES